MIGPEAQKWIEGGYGKDATKNRMLPYSALLERLKYRGNRVAEIRDKTPIMPATQPWGSRERATGEVGAVQAADVLGRKAIALQRPDLTILVGELLQPQPDTELVLIGSRAFR